MRPITHVNLDTLNASLEHFAEDEDVTRDEIVPIVEIMMRNLRADGDIDLADFVSRAEALSTTGYTVMISDFFEDYRLTADLSRYAKRRIASARGAGTRRERFDESFYASLGGGILEMLRSPLRYRAQDRRLPDARSRRGAPHHGRQSADHDPLDQLYGYLVGRQRIQSPENVHLEDLDIHSR